MIGLPIILGVIFAKRLNAEWRIYGVGVVAFVASQVLHIPFNAFILAPLLENLGLSLVQTELALIAICLAYGLSAGVFEEGARYLVYRFWLRKERSWREGLMFGLGHGGIEAILLGALAAYALMQAFTLRGVDLSTVVPAEQMSEAAAQLEAYWSLPWYAALLGALERVFALAIQISLAVLVLQAFRRRQVRWGIAAVLWHTWIDAVAVYGVQSWGIYITEGLMAVAAILSLAIIFRLRDDSIETEGLGRDQVEAPPRPAVAAPVGDDEDVTAEDIEGSRFI
jgi:uncharacterized membrane protein YhfC